MNVQWSWTAAFGLVLISAFPAWSWDVRPDAGPVVGHDDFPPEALGLLVEARQAWAAEDYRRALELYEQLDEAVPQFPEAKGARALCLALTGRTEEALQVGREALRLDPSLDVLWSLVLVLDEAGASPQDVEPYRTLAYAAARRDAHGARDDPLPLIVLAGEALQRENDAEFRRAVSLLMERFPERAESRYFNALRAARDGHWITAERELLEAGRRGVPPEQIRQLLDAGVQTRARIWRVVYGTLAAAGVWILGLLGLFVAGKALSGLTLASIGRDGFAEEVSLGELLLRRVYRRIVALAALYYYVSVPFVVLLTVAAPVVLLWGLLMLPVISVQALVGVVLFGLCSLAAAFSGIRACFVRLRDEDPGRAVSPEEAPGLWELSRQVAAKVGTRPVDEIWLSLGPEVAVFERGTSRERARDRGRRALLLGQGALEGLQQHALCAILAHEYGHFRHRDTAGGDVALRMNASMARFAEALIAQQATGWWDISFQFLRLYHFLFRRLSFGASRLQEVLADRVAVRAYGPAAFEEGLTHVVRKSVEFHGRFSTALSEAVRTGKIPADFYRRPPLPAPEERRQIECEIADQLARSSSADDTHPSPAERFALARRLGAEDPASDDRPVWELFADAEALTDEMTAQVSGLLQAQAEAVAAATAAHIRDCDAFLADTPSDPVYEERGRARMSCGDDAAAVADFTTALRLDPERDTTYFWRGMAYKNLGRHEEAAADLEQALARTEGPARLAVLQELGECCQELDRTTDALRTFSLLLEADPGSLAALLGRGRVRLELEDTGGALADFTAAIEACPHCHEAWADRGLAWKVQGDYGRASADYEEAVRRAPGFAEARIRYAWLLGTCPDPRYRDGNLAVEHAVAGGQLTGWKGGLEWDTLAAARAESGDFPGAGEAARRAAELLHAEERAACLERLDHFQAGRPWHESARATFPGSATARTSPGNPIFG